MPKAGCLGQGGASCSPRGPATQVRKAHVSNQPALWRWHPLGGKDPDRSAWGTPQRPRGMATTFINTILTRRPSAAQHPQKPPIQNEVLPQQGSSHLRAAATRRGGNHQSLKPEVTTDEPTQALGWALKPCKNKQEASDVVRSKWPALIDAEWGGGFMAMTILFLLCIRT